MSELEDALESVIDEIRADARARAEVPEESCGFMVQVADGPVVFLPKENELHSEGEFLLKPRAYHEAAQEGQIIALVHSHLEGPAAMSDMDWSSCHRSRLPWVVFSVTADEAKVFYPKSQDEDYVGRPYRKGDYDCHTLAQEFYLREYDIAFELPDDIDPFPKPGCSNPLLEAYSAAGFDILRPEAGHELEPGDLILYHRNSSVPNQVAVYLGEGKVLKHPNGLRSRVGIFGRDMRSRTDHIMRYAPHAQEGNR